MPVEGIEPTTFRLQGECSTSWAKQALNLDSRTWTYNPLVPNQVLSQIELYLVNIKVKGGNHLNEVKVCLH